MRFVIVLLSSFLLVQSALAADIDCASLEGLACRSSLVCSWDCDRNEAQPQRCLSKYFCRPKTDKCEQGFRQIDLAKYPPGDAVTECENRAGCFFDNRGCYCPCEDTKVATCACACGGGAPANCRTKK